MKNHVVALFLAASLVQATAQVLAQTQPDQPTQAGKPNVLRWTCNAFYLPSRSIWQRRVDVESDADGVRKVQIDGAPVYTFNVEGTVILTAIDSERIQFDIAAQTWTSDMRGLVSSQGRCDRVE